MNANELKVSYCSNVEKKNKPKHTDIGVIILLKRWNLTKKQEEEENIWRSIFLLSIYFPFRTVDKAKSTNYSGKLTQWRLLYPCILAKTEYTKSNTHELTHKLEFRLRLKTKGTKTFLACSSSNTKLKKTKKKKKKAKL